MTGGIQGVVAHGSSGLRRKGISSIEKTSSSSIDKDNPRTVDGAVVHAEDVVDVGAPTSLEGSTEKPFLEAPTSQLLEDHNPEKTLLERPKDLIISEEARHAALETTNSEQTGSYVTTIPDGTPHTAPPGTGHTWCKFQPCVDDGAASDSHCQRIHAWRNDWGGGRAVSGSTCRGSAQLS